MPASEVDEQKYDHIDIRVTEGSTFSPRVSFDKNTQKWVHKWIKKNMNIYKKASTPAVK